MAILHRSLIWQLAVSVILAATAAANDDGHIEMSLGDWMDTSKVGSKHRRQQCRTITDILCETAVFSSFCEVMSDVGLEDILDDMEGQWTVFAPTNTAMRSIDIESILLPVNDTDPLADFVRFHILTDQVVNAGTLACGEILVMDSGGEATVLCPDNGRSSLFLAGPQNNHDVNSNDLQNPIPQVVVTDIIACNGLLHVLTGVLLDGKEQAPAIEEEEESLIIPAVESEQPMEPDSGCQSIQDVVCEMEHLTWMCAFLDDESILTSATTTNNQWTLFAPNDEAFGNIEETLTGLEVDVIDNILKYHTVPGEEMLLDDLVCETDVIMGNGQASLTTCSDSSDFVYQKGPGNVRPPRLIETNLMACNGVVHVVNNVMLPDL